MKSLFNKIFYSEESPERSAEFPIPVSIHNLLDHHKRAIIGWIANRMGQLLRREDCKTGSLIYFSFSKEVPFPKEEDEGEYLIYLAAALFEWLQAGEDVYLQIKLMKLQDKYHKCLLEVYEEIKKDICRILPRKQHISDEHKEEDAVWQVYRDVIYAVTQRKFLLIHKEEVDGFKVGRILCEARIVERSDIPAARNLAKQSLMDNGFSQTDVMGHLLVISEAITNILKHAREGKMLIVQTASALHVLVEDKGPGFPLKLLPNTILMAGYSTKKSLGQGFTLMMKMAELILLSTIPDEGSTLILVFKRLPKEEEQSVKQESVG